MAPLRFTLTVAGDVQVDRTIEAIDVNAQHLDVVLRDIARDLRKVTEAQFATLGGYASGGWAALTDAYRKRKAQMVAAHKIINGRPAKRMEILRLTDRLKDSLLVKGNAEHVESIHHNTLLWGTTVPYAAAHQNPKQLGRKRRRFLELPETKRQAYARALLTYVRTGKSGL